MNSVVKQVPKSIRDYLSYWGKDISGEPLDLNSLVFDGITILHQLVINGLTEPKCEENRIKSDFYSDHYMESAKACEELLELGADVNTPDDNGLTALGWAIMINNYNTIEVLLRHGAKTYVLDRSGRQLREMAKEYHSRGMLSKRALNLIELSDI